MNVEAIVPHLPRSLRRPFRRVAYFPADVRDAWTGRRDPLVPPLGLRAVGEGDFRKVGGLFLELFRETAGLEPSDRVLDAGCGIGRVAVALAGFLDARGSYDGFDVVRSDIRWCKRSISARFPRFRFRYADVANSEYNPRGLVDPETFVFPYPDASFDLAFATSLFTHLVPRTASRYLSEAARVLAPGGRLFVTAFLLDEAARDAAASGRTGYAFAHALGEGAFTADRGSPEAAVGWETGAFLEAMRSAGLVSELPVSGSWKGGSCPSFQDVVVARRPGP